MRLTLALAETAAVLSWIIVINNVFSDIKTDSASDPAPSWIHSNDAIDAASWRSLAWPETKWSF